MDRHLSDMLPFGGGAATIGLDGGGFRNSTTWMLSLLSVLTLCATTYFLFFTSHFANTSKPIKMLMLPAPTLLLGFVIIYTTNARDGVTSLTTEFPSSTISSSATQFTIPPEADRGENLIPNILDPQAVDPQTICPGYRLSNVKNGSRGFTADLDLAGDDCSVYGNDVHELVLTVKYQYKDRLHVGIQPRHIGNENRTWFILPEEIISQPASEDFEGDSDLEFSWVAAPVFSFTVTRRSTGDVLFTTDGTKLVYEDQFIEVVSSMPENYNLYGLGEVLHGFRLGNNLTRTLYTADAGDPVDANIYGTHPVYLETRYYKSGAESEPIFLADTADTAADYVSRSHGVFLRNAHGQEILLKESTLTWRMLGGSLDFYFYSGPSAAEVIRSYQKTTAGLPAMQQYFSFGYHQCRWGYTGWDNLQQVVDDFKKFQIPLETIWGDIDYMNQYRDFDNGLGRWNYGEAAKFLDRLHANGQHFVPIVDAAIYVPNPDNKSDVYPTYDRGIASDAFMLNPDGSLYIGAVWPGYTGMDAIRASPLPKLTSQVFPDWVGAVLGESKTFEWWANELKTWHAKVPYDGIWIDMNEVSSFCVGSCGSSNLTLNPVHPPFKLPGEPGNEVWQYPEGFEITNATEAASALSLSASIAAATSAVATSAASSTTTSYLRTTPTPGMRNINHPPYVINHVKGDLAVHAVSPNATHHGGAVEYDFHNLFGHMILNATYQGLLSVFPGKRPFIIGRSTFASSGKLAGHWGGDNYSKWAFMYFSIPQALSFSIFGIPMFGPDTCGLMGNADLELCSRWMQLSAFFPFYRNHNNLGSNSQEPYRWAAVAEASRVAMKIRYALLPYMYTAFYRAHTAGDTVMRALAWEFPDEPWLAAADRQFLLGPAVLVTPCMIQGATTVEGVFPGAGKGTIWYDWYTQAAMEGVSRGQNVTIDAPLGHIPVYIRGGFIIPLQQPGMTTKQCRQNPWELLVALDGAGSAKGLLYVDDGESLAPADTLSIEFTASDSRLRASPTGSYPDSNPLARVTIMGVDSVTSVSYNNKPLSDGWSLNGTSNVLTVDLSSVTGDGAWSSAWELEWR